MTGTDIREALRSVADATRAPEVDQLAFQRVVRHEQRRRHAGRAAAILGVAATVALAGLALAPFVHDEPTLPPTSRPSNPPARATGLDQPAYVSVDGRLTAVDPSGRAHDLGVQVEEVLGGTTEFVYAVDAASRIVRFDVTDADLPGQGLTFDKAPSGVTGPVSSAQLSADGRYLGWLDTGGLFHERDLKAGQDVDPFEVGESAYLVDVSGDGVPLVSETRGLVRYAASGETVVDSPSWDATSTRDLLAVPSPRSTRLYRYAEDGAVQPAGRLPGSGRLSPYGDHVATLVSTRRDDAQVRVGAPGEDLVEVPVDGRPYQLAWADDDTLLVSASTGGSPSLFACPATDAAAGCTRLDVPAQLRIDLSR